MSRFFSSPLLYMFKGKKIAKAGREHSLNSASNDTAVEHLVEIMQELIR